jgi:hypothetical protein
MHIKPTLTLLAAMTFFPLSAGATGIHQCEATDRADWMSKADLTTKLESEGWSVRFMKPDGGCWEVYGTTPEGERVEGYFHPVTGAPELIAQRGRILFKADPEG